MPRLLRSPHSSASRIPALLALAAATAVVTLPAHAVGTDFTWNNATGNSLWSDANNWTNLVEPDANSDVSFLATAAGSTIILGNGENAASLNFAAGIFSAPIAYTLGGGSLSLTATNIIEVGGNATTTLDTTLAYSGSLLKRGLGTLAFGPAYSNPASIGDLVVQQGNLRLSSDAVLGPAANGIQLSGSTRLYIDSSFASARKITTGVNSVVEVAAGKELSLSGELAGDEFIKQGTGTISFAPGVDSSARGNAPTWAVHGTLRVQGPTNLSANGPINVVGNSTFGVAGRFEFLRDADTIFPYPVFTYGNGEPSIHVDRSPAGSRENGRHSLGPLWLTTKLRVTGGHGYGLSFGTLNFSNGSELINAAAAPLTLSSVNYASSHELLLRGPGEIRIEGAMTKNSGTGAELQVRGGRVRLGTAVPGFSDVMILNDSVLDTNGLSLAVQALTFSGYGDPDLANEPPSVPVNGPRLDLGGGTLNLGGTLVAKNPGTTALITGQINLGNSSHDISVGNAHGPTGNLTIDGPIIGGNDGGMTKTGTGILTLTGAGNTFTDPLRVSGGEARFAKTQGLAAPSGGLRISGGMDVPRTGVTLLADEQIHDSAAFYLTGEGPTNSALPAADVFLDLGNHTETIGQATLRYNGGYGSAAIKIGAQGKLILNGNLSFDNQSNGGSPIPTNLLISGPGTLDLGGAVRTVNVTGYQYASFHHQANATIEAKVVNGGIIKTGPHTLFLTNPANAISGGIEVREGFVGPGAAGLAALGSVSFTNTPAVTAGYDFGAVQGTLPGNLTIPAATGDFEIRHSSSTAQGAKLTGDITLQNNLFVNVTTGYFPDPEAGEGGLEFAGVISDGSSTFGLTKKGLGILKLGPANTYSGGILIDEGTLWVTSPGSLGDGNVPLTIDGGCLMAKDSFTLPRAINFTEQGGAIRSEAKPGLVLSGAIDWGSGLVGSLGGGTTILTGSTTGSAGFVLGAPVASVPFASPVPFLPYGSHVGHCLSLRGPAALPSGNLNFDNQAVLELGNGDFTRPLGTGPGEFQMLTSIGGGWAAWGADRTVNIGGAGQTLNWGQVSPAFLYAPGSTGALVFGSETATHTLTFVNPLTASGEYRDISTNDGPAAIDGRLGGDLTLDPGEDVEYPALLALYGPGTLEITGDLLGDFTLNQVAGTTILRGANEASDILVMIGKLVFTTPESLGTPFYFDIYAGEVDVSALPGGLIIDPEGEITLAGSITGDVTVPASMFGTGSISGDLLTIPTSVLSPEMYQDLSVGGDFSLVDGAVLSFEFPDYLGSGERIFGLSVAGSVDLQGSLELEGVGDYFDVGETYILIANAGNDPIQGGFENLPEGTVIPVGGGYGFKISYQANGDGGAIANDFGVTVIALAVSADARLTASAPVSVEPGAEIAIRYSLANTGATATTGTEFQALLPAGVSFIGSVPPGQWNGGTSTFTLALPDQEPGTTEDLVLRFAAPAAQVPGTARVAATYHGSVPGETPAEVETVTAVLPGGRPPIPTITRDPLAAPEEQLEISFETLEGIRYVHEASPDLIHWYGLSYVYGDGEPYTTTYPYYPDYETSSFFRFRVVPAAESEEP